MITIEHKNTYRDEVGVLLIHGFTSTPQSMEILQATLGNNEYNVSVPLLPGHGTSIEDLSKREWREWVDCVLAAYDELDACCDNVFVVGLSMGGALASIVSARRNVNGVFLINPAFKVDSPLALFSGLLKRIIPVVPGIGSVINDPRGLEVCYDRVPVSAVHQLRLLCAQSVRELSSVRARMMVFKSRRDDVVGPASLRILNDNYKGERVELVWLRKSNHVATLDYDKHFISSKIIGFIKEQLKEKHGLK